MKVRAIRQGFYGCLRYPGDEFSIACDQQYSKSWMVKIQPERVVVEQPAPVVQETPRVSAVRFPPVQEAPASKPEPKKDSAASAIHPLDDQPTPLKKR